MANFIGAVPIFELGQDWNIFKERLSQWLTANTLLIKAEGKEDEQRKAVLLSALNNDAYKLVREVIAPKTVEEISYKELTTELDKHFVPNKSVLAERYIFHTAAQDAGEDLTQWAARVRRLAVDCKFGTAMDEMLRDRFIIGMLPGPERDKLFMDEKASTTLPKALEIAVAVNSAKRAARQSSTAAASTATSTDVFKIAARPAKSSEKCSVCGYNNHTADKCRFATYKCKKCGEKGHLKKMCKKKCEQVNCLQASNDGSDDDGKNILVCNIRSFRGEPMTLSVDVNGQMISFEVDSGSCATAIPLNTYTKYFSNVVLEHPKSVLKAYSGEELDVVGVMKVPILYVGEKKIIEIYVIKGAGPALLGRNFLSLYNLQLSKVNHCQELTELDYYQNKYPTLFSNTLGKFNKHKIKLTLKPDSKPRFFRARTVPFSLKSKVEKELNRLVETGVIIPVEHSEFASPIVPVLKKDGEIRVCADFSVSLNKCLHIDKYPLPRTEELFSKLHGGIQFSQLDLSSAYLQLMLDEDSQIYTTINTHKGLFKFTRLVFGLASAPAIFQKTMENLLNGIEGVLCLLDDVLITGNTKTIHTERLQQVFHRLQEAGFVLNKTKCKLFQDSVTYLGFVIDKKGIHTSLDKVTAMTNTKAPNNVQELKSFLGFVNYYRMFIPNASSILSPLNDLLKKDVDWSWSEIHKAAFDQIKKELTSARTLAHFDPSYKLVLTVDASPTGLGAVLAQIEAKGVERPIAYASRSLSSAEKNYSQIQREATAIVFGIRRFHQYLYGVANPFILRTDHKPLMYIFHPDKGIPEVSANRLQRYALFMTSYNYEIQYVPSASNCADYFSRAVVSSMRPITDSSDTGVGPFLEEGQVGVVTNDSFVYNNKLDDKATYINFVADGHLPVSLDEVRLETSKDSTLQQVLHYVQQGWPKIKLNDNNLLPFYKCRYDLTREGGCLIRGHKLIIPKSLRNKILDELHRPHLGILKTKVEARSRFWWPQIDKDIENKVANCGVCLSLRPTPSRAPLTPWPFPERPWHRVHLDFFGPWQGEMYLIIIDAFTKWVECFSLNSDYSTATVIAKLQETMARFGTLHTIVTDNGTSFTSKTFKDFCNLNGIKHITSPTYSPSSNGQAEIYVKIIKKFLKGLVAQGTPKNKIKAHLSEFLFRYRNSKHTTTDSSPAELMLGRKLRCRFDLLDTSVAAPALEVSASSSLLSKDLQTKVRKKQSIQAKYYKGSRNIQLEINDAVLVKGSNNNKWIRGTVQNKIGKSLYDVYIPEKNITIKKHKNQLYKLKSHEDQKDNDTDWALTDSKTDGEQLSPQSAHSSDQQSRNSPGEEEEESEASSELRDLIREPVAETVAEPTAELGSEAAGPKPDFRTDTEVRPKLRNIARTNYRKFF